MIDLLGDGLTLPTALEPDSPLDGLETVGASATTISPRGIEQYEAAAFSLAEQATADADRVATLLPCVPDGAEDLDCLRAFAEAFGRRAWRRPLSDTELEVLTSLGAAATQAFDDFAAGARYVIAAALQSPYFLYRVELGEDAPDGRRLGAFELATRLALFLWNSTPDDPLLEAAASGELLTEAGLAAETDRLIADPRFRRAVDNFFTEWLQLSRLDELNKDPGVHTHFSTDLGDAAREETLRLVAHLVLERDADLGELFTTRTAFVNRRLASIYGIRAPVIDGFGRTELEAGDARRGYLGQVSFLALQAHAVSTSPTLRGKFIREVLLCDTIPMPPADLNTAIPEPSEEARTMRERLTVHREDPSCAGCHVLTDPVGLGFEQFDSIGRFRTQERGAVIDPSGDLDGTPFEDARALGELLAEHSRVETCIARRVYSYAVGRPVGVGDLGEVDRLTDRFRPADRRLRALMRGVALSEGFRRIGEVE